MSLNLKGTAWVTEFSSTSQLELILSKWIKHLFKWRKYVEIKQKNSTVNVNKQLNSLCIRTPWTDDFGEAAQ